MKVRGSVALVSGGASGLGRATAERLAADGARVVICDLPGSPGAEVAAEMGGVFVAGDVTNSDEVEAAIDAAATLGTLRTVVCCAGLADATLVLDRSGVAASIDGFSRTVSVNLIGTFNVLRLAAHAMSANELLDGDRGVLVLTSSVAAFEGQIGQAAYSAAKAGIAGMTLPVARELARHAIRVVTIAPGMFDTPLMRGLPEAAKRSLAQQVPHPSRMGRPAEFADCVAFIVANSMMNGETIRLDGAIRMAAT